MPYIFVQNSLLLYVLGVIFVATLIRSALGFGEALVAVPLLALRIPLQVAAPLAVMVSVTIAALIIVQDWQKVHFKTAGSLLIPTLFGIPLGLWVLTNPHQQLVKLLLASFIICFALYFLSRTHLPELTRDSKPWLFSCGFLAGILGGAYGMNGPPLAVYGALRRWSPQHFRATLQGYFLPASLIGLAGYVWQGLWNQQLVHYYLLSLPVAIPAILLGRLINHRLPIENFRKYVFAGLIVIALLLALQTFLA